LVISTRKFGENQLLKTNDLNNNHHCRFCIIKNHLTTTNAISHDEKLTTHLHDNRMRLASLMDSVWLFDIFASRSWSVMLLGPSKVLFGSSKVSEKYYYQYPIANIIFSQPIVRQRRLLLSCYFGS